MWIFRKREEEKNLYSPLGPCPLAEVHIPHILWPTQEIANARM